ncbi:MAG: ATP-dependent zinc metalloprotease FtsH [Ruminococcaceae bacterium]|nr:ATP-dependent zinc metalloprotease FtsH [Oscillospiraceae bacterium]
MKKSNFKVIIFYSILILLVIFASTSLFNMSAEDEPKYSEIIALFEKDEVKSFTVSAEGNLSLVTTEEKEIEFELQKIDYFREDVAEYVKKNAKTEDGKGGNLEKYNYEPIETDPWWLSFLPYLVIIILFVALWFYAMKQATGGKGGRMNSFGKAKAKLGADEKKKVFFSDVAGADEEKEELSEVVDFLKNPARFQELGARIPHGVLLVGPPGTGKTLLAKAVAGEAGVPFYSISGSDFVEMYVGVGASRVRDLFENAKKTAPSIVFIDEIDAVGRHRGAGLGGGHDEREQTLNQLLVEMDGFGSNEGVIVMAATNRPDILDPALLRPGRFDRQVTVNYPDIKGRKAILEVHAKNKHFEENVNLETLAKSTPGFTGADLANLLNEAALLSARKGKKLIGTTELEEATIKVIVGPQKKSKVVSEKDKKLTAYHEAGHAIVTHYLTTQDKVHQISIIPSGRAGGYTLSLPSEDKSYTSKIEMEEEIVSLLGGRVAEKLILNDISTGASNDIQRATEIARNMITKYGMSEKLGPVVYGSGGGEVFLGRDFSNTPNYSEKIAAMIDDETLAIVNSAFEKAVLLLNEHMDKLHFVAKFLIEHEVMDEEQFAEAMTEGATMESVEKIKEAKLQKSIDENAKKRELDASNKANDLAEMLAKEAEKAARREQNNQ